MSFKLLKKSTQKGKHIKYNVGSNDTRQAFFIDFVVARKNTIHEAFVGFGNESGF